MKRSNWNKIGGIILALALLHSGLAAAKGGGQARPAREGVVNINTASEKQLCLLPQIGPAKAKAIIDYRQRRKFKGTWDLVRIKGIGRKTFRKLRPFVTTSGETTLKKRPVVKKAKK